MRKALLRTPLVYKILVANLAIVAAGAVGGTVFTVWHVQTYPDDVHYELIAVFAGIGILISFLVNKWVLERAGSPGPAAAGGRCRAERRARCARAIG
ncbi:MAG: hypothetical protein IPK16_10195 [Anaerolineales bacterium]|nr:hypothetical protein [Anaerolineales bacterium]